ncbi:hypothetical protein J6590_066264 [Homalodisca vitripennis]|nr:hypothetical protein J6590_066264 [Homalodisca vitripennis]
MRKHLPVELQKKADSLGQKRPTATSLDPPCSSSDDSLVITFILLSDFLIRLSRPRWRSRALEALFQTGGWASCRRHTDPAGASISFGRHRVAITFTHDRRCVVAKSCRMAVVVTLVQ